MPFEPTHLYITRPEQVKTPGTAILDNAERSRADAFKFPQDRELYIAAHLFMRRTLSKHAPIAPADWRFTTNTYGKPFIATPGYEHLQFNLSHTQGMIACAVSYTGAVGVDVEKRKPLTDLDALCRYALSPLEAHDVLSIRDPARKEQRFFTYWTLKEAYIKATGMGLSIPLQEFTFTQDTKLEWRLHTETPESNPQEKWQFDTHIIGRHHLSVGIEKINTRFISTLTFLYNSGSDNPIKIY